MKTLVFDRSVTDLWEYAQRMINKFKLSCVSQHDGDGNLTITLFRGKNRVFSGKVRELETFLESL